MENTSGTETRRGPTPARDRAPSYLKGWEGNKLSSRAETPFFKSKMIHVTPKKIITYLIGFFLLSGAPPVFAEKIIPFGFCPKYDLQNMKRLYQPFIDYLNGNTPYRFSIKLSPFYQETIGRAELGETPIALCGSVPYLKAREKFPVHPILRALN